MAASPLTHGGLIQIPCLNNARAYPPFYKMAASPLSHGSFIQIPCLNHARISILQNGRLSAQPWRSYSNTMFKSRARISAILQNGRSQFHNGHVTPKF